MVSLGPKSSSSKQLPNLDLALLAAADRVRETLRPFERFRFDDDHESHRCFPPYGPL
jgi:hypothetical protein